MRRREFISALGGGVAMWPLSARAQQPPKRGGLVFLLPGSLPEPGVIVDAFRKGLSELGYMEGQSFFIEPRGAAGWIERLPRLASEFVALKVDVIAAAPPPAGRAAQQATTS